MNASGRRRRRRRLHTGRRAALVGVAILSFGGSALMALAGGLPQPNKHDEFSYLLAADTYSRGRLANPQHPRWEHFETPHIILTPSYASKYQPAQGLALAAGQRLGGDPAIGVWLSVAVMSAAIAWMLFGLVPFRWALLGGVLTVLNFGIAGVWAQSYWGGAVAATGGALVFGALARLHRRPSWPMAVVFGAGAAVLLFSRPFEGAIAVLAAVGAVVVIARRWSVPERWRAAAALGSVAVIAAVLLGSYSLAVTGDARLLPYQLHSREYDAAPLFLFQDAPPTPTYRTERLEKFHTEWEFQTYESQRSFVAWGVGLAVRPVVAGMAYLFGPPKRTTTGTTWLPGVLILPILVLPLLVRTVRERYAFGTIALLFLALSLASYFVPHYLAVAAGLWMYLVVQALRRLRARLRHRPSGRFVVPVAVAWSCLLAVISTLEQRAFLSDGERWFRQKQAIAAQLAASGGEHVVLVRYAPDYDLHAEWVYNSAEIDAQPVVWAHELDPERNLRLVEYYAERTPWLLRLRADAKPELVPCRLQQISAGTCGDP